MKQLFIFLGYLFCITTVFSQIKIEGNVTNTSKEALFGASVYVDGTTIGTVTDENGFFSLTIPSNINSVLVFSYFGYSTKYQDISPKLTRINTVLIEDVKELKEVVVQQNRFSRKQMLQLFREQFLGTNKAGSNCVIENEDELYFDYDNKSFVFKAYSDKPLLISNAYLSYKIQFQLVDFECEFYKLSINSSDILSALYAGTSFFTDIDTDKKYLKRREKSYEGSSLQFFRNLVSNKWGKDDFLLFEGSFMTNPTEHFKVTIEKEGIYKINVTKQPKKFNKKGFIAAFNILHDKKEQSKITFFTNTFYVDSYGLFSEYDKIYFSGDITKRKVGDMLPSNYGL
ncbi:hypothetical protein FIA58_002380 [Flavobacterium jejuense]|uniref:TonB-dependent receptor SusC n=1 Tax=Flavobacterium jejuense TaxID=1544455 RepID=A0ABX0IMQ4_9FLAO|nr:carboxypeptidase-like regulatory domain-containing protein [Flavobacterium jejuense]NHN24511.1 hypothetical protein [Flavobacterium jejuense]